MAKRNPKKTTAHSIALDSIGIPGLWFGEPEGLQTFLWWVENQLEAVENCPPPVQKKINAILDVTGKSLLFIEGYIAGGG